MPGALVHTDCWQSARARAKQPSEIRMPSCLHALWPPTRSAPRVSDFQKGILGQERDNSFPALTCSVVQLLQLFAAQGHIN